MTLQNGRFLAWCRTLWEVNDAVYVSTSHKPVLSIPFLIICGDIMVQLLLTIVMFLVVTSTINWLPL